MVERWSVEVIVKAIGRTAAFSPLRFLEDCDVGAYIAWATVQENRFAVWQGEVAQEG